MRGAAAARAQEPAGGDDAVDVLGRGVLAHEDRRLALRGEALRGRGVERDRPRRDARAGGHGAGEGAVRARADQPRARDRREIEAAELPEGRARLEQPFLDLLDRDPQRRPRGALAGAGLEHVQAAVLHREFEFLRVAELALERMACGAECPPDLGQHQREALGVAGAMAPGDHVLALAVEEEIDVQAVLAGRRVARERDPGARGAARVAEYHALHRHRGADARVDAVQPPVGLRAVALPGAEHGRDRGVELGARVLGEALAGRLLEDREKSPRQRRERAEIELARMREARGCHRVGDRLVERRRVGAVHRLGERLDEPAVGIPGEPRVAGEAQQPAQRGLVEPHVEQRIHHPGHRHRSARAHRDEQRPARVAEAQAARALQFPQRRVQPRMQAVGRVCRVLQPGTAQPRSEHEPFRHRQPEARHPRQVVRLEADRLRARRGREGVQPVDLRFRRRAHCAITLPSM